MNKTALLLSIFIICSGSRAFSQSDKVEHIQFFGNRIDNPVNIEVTENNGNYTFYATNRSYYPYEVNLVIDRIQNLRPSYVDKSFIVSYGKSFLISLNTENPEIQPDYNYTYKYNVSLNSDKIDPDYPYLLPAKRNVNFSAANRDEDIHNNTFRINPADTVYAMRKGLVVAVPGMYHQADRISRRKSFEILHGDGTIMIYENINPEKVFLNIGEVAYPAQPLGQALQNKAIEVMLVKSNADRTLKAIEIYYSIDYNTSKFSEELITKELNRKELRTYKKGKLY